MLDLFHYFCLHSHSGGLAPLGREASAQATLPLALVSRARLSVRASQVCVVRGLASELDFGPGGIRRILGSLGRLLR